jgi:hypothetical protein
MTQISTSFQDVRRVFLGFNRLSIVYLHVGIHVVMSYIRFSICTFIVVLWARLETIRFLKSKTGI